MSYETLEHLVKLVLACRPENLYRLGPAEMLQDIFEVASEAHVHIARNASLLPKAFDSDVVDAVVDGLELKEFADGSIDTMDRTEVPLKIEYALELLREHGITSPESKVKDAAEA